MKTSKKLILSFLGFMLLIMLVVALVIKHKIFKNAAIGDENIVEVTQALPDFNRVELNRNILVLYSQGEVSNVTIKADSNLVDKIEVVVENNTLLINVDEVLIPSKKIEITVTGKYLDEIKLDNDAKFKTIDSLKQNSLNLVCNTGSYIFIRGRFNNLNINSQAGAVSDIEGYCNTFTIQSSTGGRVNADSLDVNSCSVISGTGAVSNIFVLKSLEINANTGAMIFYKGNPEIKKTDLSSGAQLVSK